MLRNNIFYYVAFAFAFALIYPYIFNENIFAGGDNANYYTLAKSLKASWEYQVIYSPHHPPANHFPPGYPFILSLFMRIGIDSITGLKVMNGLFLLGTTIVTFLIGNKFFKNKLVSGLISLILLLNAHALSYSTILMSESSFMFFCSLSILFVIRLHETGLTVRSRYFILLIICIVIAIYIRTQGIALLGAFVFYLLTQKKYKMILIALPVTILLLLPWQMRSARLGGNSYTNQLLSKNPYDVSQGKMGFSDWLLRIQNNAVRYSSKEVPSLLIPGLKPEYGQKSKGAPVGYWIIGCVAMALMLFGIWKMTQFRWLLLSFFGANLVIFLAWPDVWFGIRFVLPLLPFMLILLLYGIQSTIQLFWKSGFVLSGNVVVVPTIALFFLYLPSVKNLHESRDGLSSNWTNYYSVSEWCGEHLKPSDIVVTRKPGLFYMNSNTYTLQIPTLQTIDKSFAVFDSVGVDYIVLEQLGFRQTGQHLYPLLVKEPDRFELIYSLGAKERKDANGNTIRTPDGVWLYKYTPEFGFRGRYTDDQLKTGPGMYLYRNGDTLQGIWKNDTLNGAGTYFNKKNGMYQTGTWENGKKEGMFILHFADQRVVESYWKHDTIQPIGYVLDKNGNRGEAIRLR